MSMNFDPMTGKPINNVPKFDPMTGRPINTGTPKKKNNMMIWIIAGVAAVIAAICLVGGIAVFAAANGILLSTPNKVLLATYNTITEGNKLVEDISDIKVFDKDELTAEVILRTAVADMEVFAVNGKKEKQVSAYVDIPGYPDIEAIASLDEEYLKLQIPTFSDDVLGYNYIDEKTGFLADNIEYEYFDIIDEALLTVYEGGSDAENEDFVKDIKDVLSTEYDALEFEKADNENYRINDKKVKCKGYTTTLTEDFFINVVEGIGDVVYDYYGDELDDIIYEASGMFLDEMFEEIAYELEGMPEINLTFYIYKNKLASILIENEYDSEIEVLFLGGDTRMQNMEILVDGDTVMEIEGESYGSEDVVYVVVDGEDVIEFSYDSKSGDFYCDIMGEFYTEGVITTSKKEFRIDIDELVVEDTDIGSGSIYVYQGAELVDIDGDLFDIGNASEGEWMDFALEYSELLEGMISY